MLHRRIQSRADAHVSANGCGIGVTARGINCVYPHPRVVWVERPRGFAHNPRNKQNSRGKHGLMVTTNPFAELSASISPAFMKTYVVIMIILVVGGTLFDVLHKGSAKYFFESWRAAKNKGRRQVGGAEMAAIAIQTAVVDVATSAEFCTQQRRIAHLLTMYGFLAYVISTAVMVFGYPTTAAATPALWPFLWHLGALMVCVGGYWFWFFIRVDVAAEGNSPFRLMRADLFVLSLLASATLGLIWSILQASGAGWSIVFFWLYIIASTVLFGSVPWSKFAHMFFKPAAAMQKRVAEADGSRNKLPAPADKPEIFGSARREPRHY